MLFRSTLWKFRGKDCLWRDSICKIETGIRCRIGIEKIFLDKEETFGVYCRIINILRKEVVYVKCCCNGDQDKLNDGWDNKLVLIEQDVYALLSALQDTNILFFRFL